MNLRFTLIAFFLFSMMFSCTQEEDITVEEIAEEEGYFPGFWEYLYGGGNTNVGTTSYGNCAAVPCIGPNYSWGITNLANGYISRFYDSRYGSHFLYAKTDTEYYVPEIILEKTWKAPLASYPNAVRVFFYDHAYGGISYRSSLMTTNNCELGLLPGSGRVDGMQQGCSENPWYLLGISGYLCSSPTFHNGVNYNVAIYRKRNPSNGMYLYTDDPNEANGSYVFERIIGYAANNW